MTVNMQFRAKTDELTEVNNDMANLLNSAEVATLFLSNNLHIKRFTPSVTQIIPLVQTDIGRPVTHLTSNLRYENLVRDVKEVLARLSPKEVEVESTDGQWYRLRIIPYRTLDNFIGGAVLSFHEITPLKQTQNQLQAARNLAQDLLDALPGPALVLNGRLEVDSANGAFLNAFRLEEEQIRGRPFFNLGNGQWDTPALRGWMQTVLTGIPSGERYQADAPAGMPGGKPLQLRARRLRNGEGEEPCLLVTVEENLL
jgi:two-component system CheB/CheR fusion protein